MSALRFPLHYRNTDSISLPDAARRRWIGVKGIRSSIMTAKVQIERGPDQLNVLLSPAKLLEGGPVGVLQGIAPPARPSTPAQKYSRVGSVRIQLACGCRTPLDSTVGLCYVQ